MRRSLAEEELACSGGGKGMAYGGALEGQYQID